MNAIFTILVVATMWVVTMEDRQPKNTTVEVAKVVIMDEDGLW